jgi:hypothetical protein
VCEREGGVREREKRQSQRTGVRTHTYTHIYAHLHLHTPTHTVDGTRKSHDTSVKHVISAVRDYCNKVPCVFILFLSWQKRAFGSMGPLATRCVPWSIGSIPTWTLGPANKKRNPHHLISKAHLTRFYVVEPPPPPSSSPHFGEACYLQQEVPSILQRPEHWLCISYI